MTLGLSTLDITQGLLAILSSTCDITGVSLGSCLTTVPHGLHTGGCLINTRLISLVVSVHRRLNRPCRLTHSVIGVVGDLARCSCISLRTSLKLSWLRQTTTSINFTCELTIRLGCHQRAGVVVACAVVDVHTARSVAEQQTAATATRRTRITTGCTRADLIGARAIGTVDGQHSTAHTRDTAVSILDTTGASHETARCTAATRARAQTATTTHQTVSGSRANACANTTGQSGHQLAATSGRRDIRVQELINNLRDSLVETLHERATEVHHLPRQENQQHSGHQRRKERDVTTVLQVDTEATHAVEHVLQTAFEDARNRQNDLLDETVDEHGCDDLGNHRKGVDKHLRDTCHGTQRCERNRRDDVHRVLNRTGEHTERVTQTEHDEAEQSHSAVYPVQPAHASRTNQVHRVVVLTSSRRHRVARRVGGCRVLVERRVQIVIHGQRRQVCTVEVLTEHHPVTSVLIAARRERNGAAFTGRLETRSLTNLQHRVIRCLGRRTTLAISLGRTIGLNIEPGRRTALDPLLVPRCLLADTTLNGRIKVGCLVRLSSRVTQEHLHRRNIGKVLQTAARCRICLCSLRGDRAEARHINVRHRRECTRVRKLVDRHRRLAQLVHRCASWSLLRRIPLKRGIVRHRKTILLCPVLEVHKGGDHNARRTHTSTRCRVLHNTQRCCVHRSNERQTHTEEEHADNQLLQAAERITLLPHERRDDEDKEKERNEHSP